MPTTDEVQYLIAGCTWEAGYLNGVAGFFIIGPNGNSIFVPFAGYRDDVGLYNEGYNGCYWSGTWRDYDRRAFDLYCAWDLSYWNGNWDRSGGLPVRPVSE